ncbi:unnamed protein product [Cochlearia groenlandica]
MVYGWKFKTQMSSILAMNQKLEEDFEMRLLGENSHTTSLFSRASMRQRVSDLAYQFNDVMKFHLWHKWRSKNHVQNFTTRKVHSLEAEIIRLCTMGLRHIRCGHFSLKKEWFWVHVIGDSLMMISHHSTLNLRFRFGSLPRLPEDDDVSSHLHEAFTHRRLIFTITMR